MRLSISEPGLHLIKSFEGLRLNAYQDSVGVWTIGYGSTMYKDGTRVKQGDTITEAAAADLLKWGIDMKAAAVGHEILNPLNQNQVDAILCRRRFFKRIGQNL